MTKCAPQIFNQFNHKLLFYWQQKGKLPANLNELNDPVNGFTTPTDIEKGIAYTYQKTSETSLKYVLCLIVRLQRVIMLRLLQHIRIQ